MQPRGRFIGTRVLHDHRRHDDPTPPVAGGLASYRRETLHRHGNGDQRRRQHARDDFSGPAHRHGGGRLRRSTDARLHRGGGTASADGSFHELARPLLAGPPTAQKEPPGCPMGRRTRDASLRSSPWPWALRRRTHPSCWASFTSSCRRYSAAASAGRHRYVSAGRKRHSPAPLSPPSRLACCSSGRRRVGGLMSGAFISLVVWEPPGPNTSSDASDAIPRRDGGLLPPSARATACLTTAAPFRAVVP